MGLGSQEQKHNFEVLPLNHLGNSEMIAFEFIASLPVYLTFRQPEHSNCGVTGVVGRGTRGALGTDNICFFGTRHLIFPTTSCCI